jgi:hypothetical protein
MKSYIKLVRMTLLAGLLLTSCGRDSFGDLFFRVWFDQSLRSGDCATQNSSASTIYDAVTVVAYEGDSNTYYLDIYDSVLEGTKDGDHFNFTGSESQGSAVYTVTVDFEVSGEDVTGQQTEVETDTGYNCTTTTDFTGVKVNDVGLQYSM